MNECCNKCKTITTLSDDEDYVSYGCSNVGLCPCHTSEHRVSTPIEWENKFEETYKAMLYNEDRDIEDIKSFIRQLLTEQRQRIIMEYDHINKSKTTLGESSISKEDVTGTQEPGIDTRTSTQR